MLFPISGDRRIDCPCFFVENWLWVSIFPNWAVNRLPDVELLTGTRVRSKGKFILIGFLRGEKSMAEIIALGGLRHSGVRSLDIERVLIGVEIDIGIWAKTHGIRPCHKCSVVMIGIKHLHCQRFPTAGGTTIHKPRPTLANPSELFLDG